MRKIVLSLTVSLDNYIARADGGYDWILVDQENRNRIGEFFKTVDTVLIGRKMHDLMVGAGMPSYAGMKNYVFSHNKTGKGEGGVEFVSGELRPFVEKLRGQVGKAIWLAGGGELVDSFMKESLVDEISLAIQPILLGEGIPLFPGKFAQTRLRLTDCKPCSSGVVALTYEVFR